MATIRSKPVSKTKPATKVYTWTYTEGDDVKVMPDGSKIDLPVFWVYRVTVRGKQNTNYISMFGEKLPLGACSPTAAGAKTLALEYIKRLVAAKKVAIAKEKVVIGALEAISLSDISDNPPWLTVLVKDDSE